MKKIIVVAGATGNRGSQIVQYLISKKAEVRAVVRSNTSDEKISALEKQGVNVFKVNMLNVEEVTAVCEGATCVVSALAGLKDVIIDTQKVLLDAAVASGVPRFIPSDYSLDFTRFSDGENRNLDLRRAFHTYLDKAPIAATTIFNGAFADMLTGQMPMILFKQKMIIYWGKADHQMGFTTINDTAHFTAQVALDNSSPRYLHIAGDQISARELKEVMTQVSGKKFRILRTGGPFMLSTIIKIAKKLDSNNQELYPAWQGMQYMRNMIDKRSDLPKLDNDRYEMQWTSAKDLLTSHQASGI